MVGEAGRGSLEGSPRFRGGRPGLFLRGGRKVVWAAWGCLEGFQERLAEVLQRQNCPGKGYLASLNLSPRLRAGASFQAVRPSLVPSMVC